LSGDVGFDFVEGLDFVRVEMVEGVGGFTGFVVPRGDGVWRVRADEKKTGFERKHKMVGELDGYE
jgi:hypothetical protein